MSSETSTEKVRLQPDRGQPVRAQADQGLQPWQFFVLAALGCATAVTFIARGQSVTSIVFLSILMASAALVGLAALRTLRPLISTDEDRTVMIGHRTRVALEREKMLALRSIKELEFDRAMGKLSDADWKEMSGRLRARVGRLMRQLDAGAGYRDRIELELEKRLATKDAAGARLKPPPSTDGEGPSDTTDERSATASAERVCASCGTLNDADARFCKSCGQKI
jgi:hypothetical protein